MHTGHVNNWLTLGANLAVLAGIGLLIFELQQNGAMIRAQTRSQISSELIDLLSQVASDPELASLVRRADNGDELTPDEEKQYGHRSAALFRFFENVHYQYRQGLYDEIEYQAHRKAWRVFFETSVTAANNWCDYRKVVSPRLKAEIDSLITESPCIQE